MRFVNVVISNNSKELDRQFCYSVPDDIYVEAGMRVLVPFGGGNKTVEAVVLEVATVADVLKTKSIIKVIDKKPLCTKQQLELALWIRENYLCTYNQAVRCVIPSGIRVKTKQLAIMYDTDIDIDGVCKKSKNKREILEIIINNGGTYDCDKLPHKSLLKQLCDDNILYIEESVDDKLPQISVKMVSLVASNNEVLDMLPQISKRAPKQAKLLEVMMQTGDIPLADLTHLTQTTSAAANSLEKKGIVRFYNKTVLRNSYNASKYKKTEPMTPTPEQQNVLDALKRKWDNGDMRPSLIRGVTGSGKTEVFLQIISYVLKQNRQAIVLVPEISLTPQTVERFVGRFGSEISVLHSGLSNGERYDEWQKILDGKVSVVVGARSAVFAPFDRLGIIIIDEEHENTYKSETAPYYSAIDIALQRGKTEGAAVILGSATPSVNSYKNACDGVYDLYEMENRHNNASMPHTEIIDMCNELKSGNKSVFSNKLKAEIQRNIENGEQTILFLNRRGFNSFITCRSCGTPVVCKNCSVTMTYHRNIDKLQCHYCGYETGSITICPECGSNKIRYMGTGTEKVEEEIRKLFGENTYLRMDADTTTGKNSHEAILKRFNKDNVPILLGTQMVTKGLDFKNVTLVGVLAADLTLNVDDFRAAERTFSQLTQVCGRAGRGEKKGRAYIQTYQPEHYAVSFAAQHNYKDFYENEIAIRKQFDNPPFCDIILIMMTGEVESEIKIELMKIAEYLKSKNLFVLGPTSAPYNKIKNKYRWRIILKTTRTKELLPLLNKLIIRYAKDKNNISIDINPNSMN